MKKVIVTQPKDNVIFSSSLKNTDIIGFITTRGDKGHFITTPDYEIIGIIAGNRDTVPMGANSTVGHNLSDTIQGAIAVANDTSYPIDEIFVFSTHKELYSWIAK